MLAIIVISKSKRKKKDRRCSCSPELRGHGWAERAMAWDTEDLGVHPGWLLTSCVTVGKLLSLSGLSFLICKMGAAIPAASAPGAATRKQCDWGQGRASVPAPLWTMVGLLADSPHYPG